MEKPTRHGTRASYSAGCRCEDCKTAWADYIRNYKRSKGQQQPRASHLVDQEIVQAEQRLAEIADGDDDARVLVALTPLGLSILLNLQRKLRQRRGEIFDRMLRDCGTHVADDVVTEAPAA